MGNDIRLATLVALLSSLSGAQAMQPVRQNDRSHVESAGTHAAQALPEFSAVDRDGDGTISEREAGTHPALAALFAELDKNHNGQLSAREYAEAKVRAK